MDGIGLAAELTRDSEAEWYIFFHSIKMSKNISYIQIKTVRKLAIYLFAHFLIKIENS